MTYVERKEYAKMTGHTGEGRLTEREAETVRCLLTLGDSIVSFYGIRA